MIAADPRRWLDTVLPGRFEAHPPLGAPRRAVGVGDLLAADAAVLRELHAGLVGGGTPAPAAATYRAGWFAGATAGAVGFGLATAGAGFVVDAAGIGWTVHPGGWTETAHLGEPGILVGPSHAWAGSPDVEVVDDPDAVVARVVAALVAAVAPVVDACADLARVGRAGLWNEVGDGLGMALAFDPLLAVTPAMTEVLDRAVAAPGAPWRSRPGLRFAPSALGPVHVAQKGGCCLAYTRDDPDLPRDQRYCSTCSFRHETDVDARQVAWLEQEHARRAGGGSAGSVAE